MLIGRANDADFQLPQDDPYVSRRHVYLEICPPSCRLCNLSNTNPPHWPSFCVTAYCKQCVREKDGQWVCVNCGGDAS